MDLSYAKVEQVANTLKELIPFDCGSEEDLDLAADMLLALHERATTAEESLKYNVEACSKADAMIIALDKRLKDLKEIYRKYSELNESLMSDDGWLDLPPSKRLLPNLLDDLEVALDEERS